MEEVILKTLNFESVNIQKNVSLYILNIEKIDSTLKKHMDKVLIDIYSKGMDSDINIVKLKLKKYFDSKKDTTLEIGSIAEFFIHLFLNLKKFQQECLYKNLEENAPKKGFDGFYTNNDEIWIMESKSGKILTPNISHFAKIKESYNDLSNKISGKSNKNNPWENAYSHAKQANSEEKILESIKKLENMYTLEKYTSISEHNIIPSSTIFYDGGDFINIDSNKIKLELISFLKGKEYSKINFICINKKTKDLFLNYIIS